MRILMLRRFSSYFDVIGTVPSVPLGHTLQQKNTLYQWSERIGPNADKFPPHLDLIPAGPDNLNVNEIFDKMRLLDTGFILSSIVPEKFLDFAYSHPDQGGSMEAIETRNTELRRAKKNILSEPNVGDRTVTKWYTDEVFAQQQFTGSNPVTIEIASAGLIKEFQQAAITQSRTDMADLIASAGKEDSLYVQDCSYFREAVGVAGDVEMKANVKGEKEGRYAAATVTLYNLTAKGKLHPLAIVVDYKVSMEKSVVIFNQRLVPEAVTDQAHDWPWRFAKTCAQSADWVRHEAAVHLTNCHLVEEATIVASHRTLPTDHLVFRCLEPHWLKTLPVNASARATLVPHVVVPLIGITDDQTYTFLRDAYHRFDWQANYVPNDLARRGFPLDKLLDTSDVKFHNYAYGKDVLIMWKVLRAFVSAFLANGGSGFPTDEKVANDPYIERWCHEMQSEDGGQMKTWPTIKTVDQLIDCVTMCIHIAAPQHTAVNYLQEYYQSFVVNKPPALCQPLPQTLTELNGYGEKQLMDALPINRPREWLLASHLVHLLNSRVAEDQNLVTYGVSLYHLSQQSGETALQDAAKKLVDDLSVLGDSINAEGETVPGVFTRISLAMDDQEVPYRVMEPVATSVSILI